MNLLFSSLTDLFKTQTIHELLFGVRSDPGVIFLKPTLPFGHKILFNLFIIFIPVASLGIDLSIGVDAVSNCS